jgi:hypothetical protein
MPSSFRKTPASTRTDTFVSGSVATGTLRNERTVYMAQVLWAIIVILFIGWVLGFAFHIAGGLIHILLLVAVILLVFNLLSGRGARV